MSFVDKMFGRGFYVAEQALNTRMAKQGLIQSNIANLETPGYNRQDFPFAKVMETALDQRGQMARTNKAHIALDPLDISQDITLSNDKRPVDLDEEMLNLSQNQLMYRVTTKILSKKFENLKYAIDEGGK